MVTRFTRGVTLIELLAVMTILGALAAIVFPVFSSTKKTAYRAVCVSNLHQIGLGTALYMGDHDDHYPIFVNEFTKAVPRIAFGRPLSIDPKGIANPVSMFATYIDARKVFICPKDSGRSFPKFKAFPELAPYNGGTSYLFAELFAGQTAEGWKDPAREIWACDGGQDWHWPPPPPNTTIFHRSNTLAFDFHVYVVEGESITPTWIQ